MKTYSYRMKNVDNIHDGFVICQDFNGNRIDIAEAYEEDTAAKIANSLNYCHSMIF